MKKASRCKSLFRAVPLTWLVLAVGGAALAGGDGEAGLRWQRRALRQAAPEGYLAVVSLAAHGGKAVLSCPAEGIELHTEGGHWRALVGGKEAARGALDTSAPPGFFVKRAPRALLVGANGRWLYGCPTSQGNAPPEIAVGVSPDVELKAIRIVAREPVSFTDDFPDPVPRTGVWAPVRGQWALSSMTYADKSANPAELAAIFDKLEDVASRGRTREYAVGVGIQLGQAFIPRIGLVANDSPAERAGLMPGDLIREVDGRRVRSASEATDLLQGEAGKPVTLVIERDGTERKLELNREIVVWGKAKRQAPIAPFCQDNLALIVAGYDFWTDYHFRSAVRTQGTGAVGLVFAYLGPRDYHVFRWLGADRAPNRIGEWRIERVRGGARELLAAREGGFYPDDLFALAVAVEGDELGKLRATCYVDSVAVVSAVDTALVPGRIGLWAEAPGVACFDDVVVGASQRQVAAARSRSSAQAADPTMRHWADQTYQWAFSGIQHWHRSTFPNDVSLSAPVPKHQRLSLTISASERGADTGYTFVLPEQSGPATLLRAGKVVATQASATSGAKRATLERQGSHILATLDGAPCVEFTDPQPLAGTLVGVAGALPADVRVESPNVVEDYFNGCPTDWHVLAGRWDVMNRWVCNPTWSFFSGRNDDGLLAIWSKRRLEGNCSVEADAGVMMMERTGRYENMRDFGLSLCANDRDLTSGYAVIVGAYQNERTVLYRRGKPVASTSSSRALLPTLRNYGRDELHSQHRGWFHVRLAKEGKAVKVYVWDYLALTYEDPDPLPGGHAAIWSVHNGLVVAKVRLAASRLSAPLPVLRQHAAFADSALTNDLVEGGARITRSNGVYEIANTASGGPFPVALRPRVFSAYDYPRLSFDIKLAPEAKVDLFFTCQGTLYRLPLGGPSDPTFLGVSLPAPEGIKADGNWHRVTLDLLGEMRKRHSTNKLLLIWEPVLANYSNQGYLLAGFGGNGAGATYWLRNIVLGSPTTPAQLSSAR